jgi:MFS family permease
VYGFHLFLRSDFSCYEPSTALIMSQAMSCFTIPMAGHWSDLLGCKRLYLLGALLAGAFGFVYFTLLNTAAPAWMFVAILLSYVPRDLMYGPQAALIAECFPPGYVTAAARSATNWLPSSRAAQHR